ncbi:MAG: hypothetical protein RLZZ175_2345 [Bacteroidota bacterium]|jgi:hypothetical protein
MRVFTVLPKVQDFELDLVEKIIEDRIPKAVRDYIKIYGGNMIKEKYFFDSSGLEWELSHFNLFKDLHGLTQEFLQEYHRKLVPFAYDPGGWHFCLSFDADTYGKIIINRWTDHLPEEQFLVIADSFEEFINGLQTEENI